MLGSVFLWDIVQSRITKSFDQHKKEISCLQFFKDWILISGGKDGYVQMYDVSLQGNGKTSMFMSKKNYFTILSKEKYLEEENEIISLDVSTSGMVLVIDKYRNARVYSCIHGKKLFKINSSFKFSLDMLNANDDLVTQFKIGPLTNLVYSDQSNFFKFYY